MAALRKIMITPFFGELPSWFDKFKENFNQTLGKQGYDWIFTQDLEDFNKRCLDKLGLKSSIMWGTGKLWDYRCALGLLYEEEIKCYDYWGHCDFDVVFGDVNKWFPDEQIIRYDLISNHHSYVNGFFSLYKNCRTVNRLFMNNDLLWKLIYDTIEDYDTWEDKLKTPIPTGWVEKEYSKILEMSGLRYRYSFFQGWPYTTTPNLHFEDGELYQDGEPIAMFHFRRSKKWPL